jgi:hypothetical protein
MRFCSKNAWVSAEWTAKFTFSGTSPVTRAYLAEFASNLHSAIRDTADNARLLDEYTEATTGAIKLYSPRLG